MFEYFHKQVKKNWNMWDVKTVGVLGMLWGVIAVKIFPALISICWLWYAILMLILYMELSIRLFRK